MSSLSRHLLIAGIVVSLLGSGSYSQDINDIILPADSVQIRLQIGTFKPFIGVSLGIIVLKSPAQGQDINTVQFAQTRASLPKVTLMRADEAYSYELRNEGTRFSASRIMVEYYEEATSEEQLIPFSNDKSFLHMDGPMRIPLNNGGTLILTPDVLKKASLGKLKLSDEAKEELVRSRGGTQVFYDNKFDIGLRADNVDSAKQQFYVSFSFSSLFPGTDWWDVAGSGTISTDPNAPFSELKLYPISFSRSLISETDGASFAMDARLSIGVEGDQSWKRARWVNKASFGLLIPNLVNLSRGYDRLRLKPVLTLKAEYWNEFKDQSAGPVKEATYKVGGEIYYFIPVQDRYSVLVEGEFGGVFGDAYKSKYNLNDFISKFDITFGYHVPDETLKVIAKYSFGQNDVQFVEDQMVVLGILVGMLE